MTGGESWIRQRKRRGAEPETAKALAMKFLLPIAHKMGYRHVLNIVFKPGEDWWERKRLEGARGDENGQCVVGRRGAYR